MYNLIMFKKLFVPIASVIAVTSSFAFVSCFEDKGKNIKNIKNIFTKVDYQQDLESKKSIVKNVIDTFVSNAQKKVDQKDNQAKKHFDFIKNNITDFIDPLTKFLIIIDKQTKEFLDFFYNIHNKSEFDINWNEISINKKNYSKETNYSEETVQGSNQLIEEFNKVIKTRNLLFENTNKITNFNKINFLSDMWLVNFERIIVEHSWKNSFFEKIGNKVLKNKIAIDFWNKFISDKIHV